MILINFTKDCECVTLMEVLLLRVSQLSRKVLIFFSGENFIKDCLEYF